MSTKKDEMKLEEVVKHYPSGYVIEEGEVGRLEGRVLTLLEALGLPEKQENAIKGFVRQELWDTIAHRGLWISGDQHSQLRRENRNLGQSTPSPLK